MSTMRILFLTVAHNTLSQRAKIELEALGHLIDVAVVSDASMMRQAVDGSAPDLIVAPFLTIAIPEDIWRAHKCLIVHPGIRGDRGASSLDWAIMEGASTWGVTIVEAHQDFDAGDIWAHQEFPMRPATKSSLYQNEVVDAAARGLVEAVGRFADPAFTPEPLDYANPEIRGRKREFMRQHHRQLDWGASTEELLRKIRAADGSPGVRDVILGQDLHLFGAHAEDQLRGPAGQVLAKRNGAICRATGDGALWISHLRRPKQHGSRVLKLPAEQVLNGLIDHVPRVDLDFRRAGGRQTFSELSYFESGAVGWLNFSFHNGAMNTDQCQRLTEALRFAKSRSTRVLVLRGGDDHWSNGIHLNAIEAAPDPAQASWDNILAINSFVHELILTTDKLTVAGMHGSAGAGGVMLALPCDRVLARSGILLNPHYQGMGGLYGSEYWTYSLPRRVGRERALAMTRGLETLTAAQAHACRLVDEVVDRNLDFDATLDTRAQNLAEHPEYTEMLADKQQRRSRDEATRPLQAYVAAELTQMRENFFGADDAYHRAREAFVY